ncbi:PD-(D/E)XK nuclease family protein [Segetibacter sp. 3557_3]|uniref:PD-(D/E)XK nuclease family protein n=1 Tax=Segetibacter sp. 3557_3 TaxID=2547429 RepID=UPI0010586126|nr:PD-(D/E)XK nuclease family protein [Segetibacter sp. 3557_3]TDH23999.1 PD-(D/E)XK nuclease family protein [Segetibacter sp. 3557_3]
MVDHSGKEPGSAQLSHPEIVAYNTAEEEWNGVGVRILELIESGIAVNDICIYLPGDEVGRMAGSLDQKGIGVISNAEFDVLRDPTLQQLVLLLRYFAAEQHITYSGDDLLFRLLHLEWFAIPATEISKLAIETYHPQSKTDICALRKKLADKSSGHATSLFEAEIPAVLKRASAMLEQLIVAASKLNPAQLVENILEHELFSSFISRQPGKEWVLQVLRGFLGFVKRETANDPARTLADILAQVDLMLKQKVPLLITPFSGNTNGVQLATVEQTHVHHPYVFVLASHAAQPQKSELAGQVPEGHNYGDLTRKLIIGEGIAQLHVSYRRYSFGGRITAVPELVTQIIRHYPGLVPVRQSSVLKNFKKEQPLQLKPKIESVETVLIGRLVDKFVMSVSALNTYLQCPLSFYYCNILRIPSGRNEYMSFGSAVHYALQRLFEKMQGSSNRFPSANELVSDFTGFMHQNKMGFTEEQFKRRLQYGATVLTNYYNHYRYSWNHVVAVERNINNVVVKGVPLKGKLDKLEFDGRFVNIVDYKTGDCTKALQHMNPPNAITPNGGNYWRQAVFYKILVDNYQQKNWQVVSTEFDFIEPDSEGEYCKLKLVLTPADVTTVTHQFVETWTKIRNHDFYTGCGNPYCYWCDFVKSNNLVTAHCTSTG